MATAAETKSTWEEFETRAREVCAKDPTNVSCNITKR